MGKEEKSLAVVESEVKLELNFQHKLNVRDNLIRSMKSIMIRDEATLMVAVEVSGKGKTFIDEVEKARKMIKKPYADKAKKVDDVAKEMSLAIIEEKKSLDGKILMYKQAKIAEAKANAEDKIENVQDWSAKHIEIMDFTKRICDIIVARIFGGSYTSKSGEVVVVSPATSEKVANEAYDFIYNKFPGDERFGDFAKQAKLIREIGITAAVHNTTLIKECLEVVGQEKELKKKGRAIEALQRETRGQLNKVLARIEEIYTKSKKTAEKTIVNEVKIASSGTRTYVDYVVLDIASVPIEYHIVDPELIKAFIAENKDAAKKIADTEEELIPGIKFVNRVITTSESR